MTKRKLLASEVIMLDPLDCGSTVGYVIRRGRRGINADINLSDCNRKIEWYFSNDPSSVDKIDRAIGILHRFRDEFLKVRRNKRKKTRNRN